MADFYTYNGQGYTSIPSSVQAHMKGIIDNNMAKDLLLLGKVRKILIIWLMVVLNMRMVL